MPFNMSKYASQHYPVAMGGKVVEMSAEQIGKLIKHRLLKSRAVLKNLQEFEIDPQRLDELQIMIGPLDSMYAQTDAEKMIINKNLFDGGHFFEQYFFIIPHELIHWMSRIKEQDAWFNDPEEVLGFVASVAYEIEIGSTLDEIWNKVYPKVSWHFNDELDASEFFRRMVEKAKKMLQN